ncbi:MAG: hypothetical protein ACKO85_11205, partial [Isosphaeraceae bacterium]
MNLFRLACSFCLIFSIFTACLFEAQAQNLPDLELGYTGLRTDLPGGRHNNIRTMRAMLVRADGKGQRLIAQELAVNDPDAWTQFAGWSPDGKTAIVGRGWQSEANAAHEESTRQFQFNAKGWLYDSFL